MLDREFQKSITRSRARKAPQQVERKMNEMSSAFISYHHNDRVIGDAIRDVLHELAGRGKGKTRIACFLDAKDIKPGQSWQKVIDDNLSTKDWLIVVYTGEESAYGGYEIGTFSQKHADELVSENPTKHLVGLHDVDVDQLPIILRPHQNTFVPAVTPVMMKQTDVVVTADEVQKWYNSPVGRLLQEFCGYNDLFVPADTLEDPSAYGNAIAWGAKSIANAFMVARGIDIKEETPSQIGFELTIPAAAMVNPTGIPGDAVVVGTTLFFHVLGLALAVARNQAPSTTWDELRTKLKAVRSNLPWLHKVETDVLLAIQSLTPSGDDVTFRASNNKIYRPILVRHQHFVNGDRRFYLLIVETLDRRFVGSPRSSLLLTALILASRWRFTYFEKWSENVEQKFGSGTQLQIFSMACRQLLYNIEWIEHESAELGVSDIKLLVDAFGEHNKARVERFFMDWADATKELLAVVPPLETEILASEQSAIGLGVMKFMETIRQQNADFLELALQTYTEQIDSDLRKDREDV